MSSENIESTRLLGIDFGERRIGVAVTEGTVAFPLKVIERKNIEADLKAILRLADGHKVECLVVGMPYSLNGTLGWQARRVEEFISQLAQFTDLPIEIWDERLSTVAAEKAFDEALGGSTKSRASSSKKRRMRREKIDALAATFILQSYLERRLKCQE